MGMYCYTNGKDTIEVFFPSYKAKPKRIRRNGKTYERDFSAEAVGVPMSKGWPMECVASGVAPSQAQELRDYYRKAGVPTEVTADGNPIYRNAAHRRKALKARGFKDKAGYF